MNLKTYKGDYEPPRKQGRLIELTTWGNLCKYSNLYPGMNTKSKSRLKYLTDPYAWALLLSNKKGTTFNDDLFCKDIYEHESNDIDGSSLDVRINIKDALSLLRETHVFDFEEALNIYNLQGDTIHLFSQIFQNLGKIAGSFNSKNASAKKRKVDYPIKLTPNPDVSIHIPNIYMELDGLPFPWAVCKMPSDLKMKEIDIDGFGSGLFIVGDGGVLDCLKINDFWLLDRPLNDRLNFLWRAREETWNWLKCWSISDTISAGHVFGANQNDGLLIRSLGEDYYKNYWLNYSVKSKTYGRLRAEKNKRARGDAQNRWTPITTNASMNNRAEGTLISLDGKDDTGKSGRIHMSTAELLNWYKIFDLPK